MVGDRLQHRKGSRRNRDHHRERPGQAARDQARAFDGIDAEIDLRARPGPNHRPMREDAFAPGPDDDAAAQRQLLERPQHGGAANVPDPR